MCHRTGRDLRSISVERVGDSGERAHDDMLAGSSDVDAVEPGSIRQESAARSRRRSASASSAIEMTASQG